VLGLLHLAARSSAHEDADVTPNEAHKSDGNPAGWSHSNRAMTRVLRPIGTSSPGNSAFTLSI
jgi:hypothetical protein